MQRNKINLQCLSWEEVREHILALNPVLAQTIDEINPSKQHRIYRASYDYGQELVRKGEFQIPTDDPKSLIALTSNDVPAIIKEDLGYNANSNPVTFVLKNSLELFIELSDRLIPYSIIPAGKMFGLSKVLDIDSSLYPEIQLWGLTAGARSIFMLPKISESISYNRLKKAFALKSDKPKELLDQWYVFRELANHSLVNQKWQADVLFFSKKWFEHFEDSAWNNFYYYLIRSFLKSSSYWRNQYLWNLLFTRINQKLNLKPSPFIMDITRHLLAIAVGAMPGFAPTIDNNVAPIQKIQELFIEHYDLKNYAPIMLAPRNFQYKANNEQPAYFSLQHCTALELGMKSSEKATALTNLYEINELLAKYFIEFLKPNELQLLPETLYELTNQVKFQFFHSQTGHYDTIYSTQELPLSDPLFLGSWSDSRNNIFSYKGHFINGCIQISQNRFNS